MKDVPYFAQERPESCVPACLRMILAYYGLVRTETELSTCCETDVDGTLPSASVRCAQSLGFDATAPRLSNLDALKAHMEAEYVLPVVFINLSPLLGINVTHAVVVDIIEPQTSQIHVIDPAYPPTGRRVFTLSLFEIGWRLARHQTILVKPQT